MVALHERYELTALAPHIYRFRSDRAKAEAAGVAEASKRKTENPTQRTFFRFWEHLVAKEVKQSFDLSSVFQKYLPLALEKGPEAAWAEIRWLLLVNMKTIVQESILQSAMHPIATEVVLEHSSDLGFVIHYRNGQYANVVEEETAKIRTKVPLHLQELYLRENQLFYNAWQRVVEQLYGLPRKKERRLGWLQSHGFVETPLENFDSLKGLFPELEGQSDLSALIGPRKSLFVLPNAKEHFKGKTSIPRHVSLAYLPDQDRFFIIDVGFFTTYRNSQIRQFFSVDAEQKPLPETTEDFYQTIAVLSGELAKSAPHALFEHVVTSLELGMPRTVKLGKNVDGSTPRQYYSQLDYIKGLFEIELELCRQNPERVQLMEALFARPAEIVHHTLLIPRAITELDTHMRKYQQLMGKVQTVGEVNRLGKELLKLAAFFDPKFFIQVGSLADCVSGSMLGLERGLRLDGSLFKNMKFNIPEAMSILKKYKHKDITDRAKFREICKKGKLNPKHFKKEYEGKKCLECKQERKPMGACMCWYCNLKYNARKAGADTSGFDNGTAAQEPVESPNIVVFEKRKSNLPPETTSLSNFISGLVA